MVNWRCIEDSDSSVLFSIFPPAGCISESLLHVVARGKTMEKRFQVPRIWKIATTQFDCTFFFCVSVDDTAELPSVPPFFVTIRPALLGYPSWQASCYM